MSTLAAAIRIQRWTRLSIAATVVALVLLVVLAFGPLLFDANVIDQLGTLFVYVMLAVMWNALAGYGGLISIGQQAFFGLGAYAAIRFAYFGLNPYASLFLAALAVGVLSFPLSTFMLRLREGEFAIGMWVVAVLGHLLVTLDPIVNGETGTSLVELNAYPSALRNALNYWAALGSMVALLAVVFFLLRSRAGASIQAIRDDEGAAASVGVKVLATKRLIFVLTAVAAALAGSMWLAQTISFQPQAYFSVQWTAYMIFMVLVGGIGTFEGAIIGAVIFFLMESFFGATGVWYLIGLGAAALGFALFFPRGIWGAVEGRLGISLLPVGYRVRMPEAGSGTRPGEGDAPGVAAQGARDEPS